jgi:hypothetical protein
MVNVPIREELRYNIGQIANDEPFQQMLKNALKTVQHDLPQTCHASLGWSNGVSNFSYWSEEYRT